MLTLAVDVQNLV